MLAQVLIRIQRDDVEHMPCVQHHHAMCSASSRCVFSIITLCVQHHHAVCSASSRCVFSIITLCVQHHTGSGSALAPPHACIMYCREHTSTRETKMWNTIINFVCFVQKLFSWLRKITVVPLMLYGLFYRSPCYVSGHGNISVVLLSMEGLGALRFKHCSHI